jgi:hypothetical protein
LKRVYSSHNLAATHHAKNLLETQGVRAVVKNEFLSSAMGDLPPAECQAEVWVLRDSDVALALEILFSNSVSGPAWTCPACGEAAEPQFTQCWRCAAERPSG